MSDAPALTARGLSVSFGGADALSDVSLDVPSGASVAMLGPNGAGKSTLFAAAIGLVAPTRGSIELHSRRVAYVPQHLDLDQTFPVTVGDVVRMGRYGDLGWFRRLGERDRALVADALETLGISWSGDASAPSLAASASARCSRKQWPRTLRSCFSTSR